jgi:carbonic anhydrase/acetyltransferase-like protein (isoleucine patch superfamily)
LINKNDRPLILIGSNSALFYIKDFCKNHNITIAGIIDSDYYGNTESLEGIPVIDSEQSFEDPTTLTRYKNNFYFFLATNWMPNQGAIHTRNRNKRSMLIDLIEHYELPCLTLVDKNAYVHESCVLGKNVFVEMWAYVSAYNKIGDYSSVHTFVITGHHNNVGRNCVLQRKSGLYDYVTLEDNVYVSLNAQMQGENIILKQGTMVHPHMVLRRSTVENEVISLVGKDLRRVYLAPVEAD